jgi:hypothetical protein
MEKVLNNSTEYYYIGFDKMDFGLMYQMTLQWFDKIFYQALFL